MEAEVAEQPGLQLHHVRVHHHLSSRGQRPQCQELPVAEVQVLPSLKLKMRLPRERRPEDIPECHLAEHGASRPSLGSVHREHDEGICILRALEV